MHQGGSNENGKSEKVGSSMKSYLHGKGIVLVKYFTAVGSPGHVDYVENYMTKTFFLFTFLFSFELPSYYQ